MSTQPSTGRNSIRLNHDRKFKLRFELLEERDCFLPIGRSFSLIPTFSRRSDSRVLRLVLTICKTMNSPRACKRSPTPVPRDGIGTQTNA